MFTTFTFPDFMFVCVCVFTFAYKYRYVPIDDTDGIVTRTSFGVKYMLFLLMVYFTILLPAQIGFNKIFDTFFIIGFFCVTIPTVIAIMIWENRPKVLVIYLPCLYAYLKFLQFGFFS